MNALTLMPVYENEVFRIGLDKNLSVLELSFLKHPDAERFRNAYRLAFDTALNKDVRYWLTDATQIKSMERENQEWLKERMMPLLKSGQLCRFAIVMAPECFVMTSPNQVYEKQSDNNDAPPSGLIKVHFDKDAAYDWMLSSIKSVSV